MIKRLFATVATLAGALALTTSPAMAQGGAQRGAQLYGFAGADWRTIYFDPSPDAEISFVMVDMGEGHVRIEGDRRLGTVAMASARRTREAMPINHNGRWVIPTVLRYFYVVDCKANTSRPVLRFTHDYNGTVIDEIEETGPMRYQPEGTTGRAIVETICGRNAGEPGSTPWDYLKDPNAPD